MNPFMCPLNPVNIVIAQPSPCLSLFNSRCVPVGCITNSFFLLPGNMGLDSIAYVTLDDLIFGFHPVPTPVYCDFHCRSLSSVCLRHLLLSTPSAHLCQATCIQDRNLVSQLPMASSLDLWLGPLWGFPNTSCLTGPPGEETLHSDNVVYPSDQTHCL